MTEPLCTGTKRCPRCGEDKHALAFSTSKTAADGLHPYCRDCDNVRAARLAGGKRVAVITSYLEL